METFIFIKHNGDKESFVEWYISDTDENYLIISETSGDEKDIKDLIKRIKIIAKETNKIVEISK